MILKHLFTNALKSKVVYEQLMELKWHERIGGRG